jgi:hypothetical protein
MTILLVHLAVVTLRRSLGPAAPYRIFFVLHPLHLLSLALGFGISFGSMCCSRAQTQIPTTYLFTPPSPLYPSETARIDLHPRPTCRPKYLHLRTTSETSTPADSTAGTASSLLFALRTISDEILCSVDTDPLHHTPSAIEVTLT